MPKIALTKQELRSTFSLCTLYALRAFGLFLLYPVLSVYATSLEGQTPLLIGLAFGAYGFSQALLQIPFGLLSDRFGRKRMIALGLMIFAVGSFVCAWVPSIYGLVFGRFLQGAGAVSAVCSALLSDLVAPERRSFAMAGIGITIGLAFSLSLVLGPLVTDALGFHGLFLMLGVFSLFGLIVLFWGVPKPPVCGTSQSLAGLWIALRDRQCLRVSFSIGALHAVLTLMFMVAPTHLMKLSGQPLSSHTTYYVIGIFISFLTVFPLLGWVERNRQHRPALLFSIGLLSLSQWGLFVAQHHLLGYLMSLAVFFVAFNYLEACLPSWLSRIAPREHRGAAMGVYSTFQFGGTFIGGLFGGILLKYSSAATLYIVSACVILLWLFLCLGIQPLKQEAKAVATT